MGDWQIMANVPQLNQLLLPTGLNSANPESPAITQIAEPAAPSAEEPLVDLDEVSDDEALLDHSEMPHSQVSPTDISQSIEMQSPDLGAAIASSGMNASPSESGQPIATAPSSEIAAAMSASLQQIETTALSLLKNGKISEDGGEDEIVDESVAAAAEDALDHIQVESSELIETAAFKGGRSFLIRQRLKNSVKYFFAFLFLLGSFLIFYFGLAPDINIESGQSTLAKLGEHVPLLRKWISPIPNLPDVSPEDLSILKAAAHEKPEVTGEIRVAIAISQSNPTSPQFYVASNTAEDLHLSLYVVGMPDTLLNQVSFVQAVSAEVSKNLVKTNPLRMGSRFPKVRIYST